MRNIFGLIVCAWASHLFGGVGGDVRLSNPPPNSATDERLYIAAVRSFQGGHWVTSARWLREFIQRHANSPRRPLAVLLLGQSYFQQGAFKEAYAALSNDRLVAGPLADEFLFWMAECRMGQGNLEAAAQIYQELLREHPESSRSAEAIVALANVSARQKDWVKVVEHLQPSGGVFQIHAANIPGDEVTLEGRLILAQALFEQGDLQSSRSALDLLPKQLRPERDWRRRLLLAKIEEAGANVKEALLMADQLRTIAEQQNWSDQLASAYQLRAELFERNSEWDKAAQEYSHLLKEGLPLAIRRRAFLNVARMRIRDGDFPRALSVLRHLQQQADLKSIQPIADCMIGEIHLLLHRTGGIDQLYSATAHFEKIAAQDQNPSLQARGLWGLAQCRLFVGQTTQAKESMQKALEIIKDKDVRAWVQYRLALEHSRQSIHDAAIIGFQNVRTNSLEGISAELLNAARFMQFKNALAGENVLSAEVLLAEMRDQPGASHLDKALLTMAQARIDRGENGIAKAVLFEFREQTPASELQAAAVLEEIRILVIERKWTDVIASYDQWLLDYPKHRKRKEVLFDRAWALAQSGQSDDAVKSFNELIKGSPNVRQAFMAKMWLADWAYNSRTNQLTAEKWYKEIRGATNCPPSLRHRAGMMAGRAAMERQGYDDARSAFTTLIDDKQVRKVSPRVHVEASFALGDLTMMELGGAAQNQIEKLTQSTNAFYSIIQESPTNAVAARAWGRIGDCCLRVSGDQPGYQIHAKTAYEKSLAVTGPVSVNVRSQAHIGLAYALERQAGGQERAKVLQESVDHLLAVFFGRHLKAGEKQDPYWRGQSGLIALRLLEQLGRYDAAITICVKMEEDFPGIRSGLKARRERLQKLKAEHP